MERVLIKKKNLPRLRVLVACADASARATLVSRLDDNGGFRVETAEATGARAAMTSLRERACDLAFVDEVLTDGTGLGLIEQIRQLHPKVALIWTTADGDSRSSIKALKNGAVDALTRAELPRADIDEVLRRAEEMHRVQNENAELRLVNRMKDEFIAGVSHELRTPLAVILGYAKTLEDGELGPVTPHQKLALKTICTRAERLLGMVNELLAYREAKLGVQQVLLHPLDLASFLEKFLDERWSAPPKAGVRLARSIPEGRVWAMADSRKLREAVDALLENALKFTAEGTVSVELSARGCAEAWISVVDTGRGIAPEALPRLFEGFFHADKELTRDVPGLGIGLALSRQIVELHGGRIWVESAGPGKGAAARIALPLCDPAAPEMVVEHRPRTVRKRILLVEDNADIVDLLRLFLSGFSQNLLVTASRNGLEALELMAQNTYDLLVLDLMIPGLSGLEVLQRMMGIQKNARVPVLILTGHKEAARQALSLGASDAILKPFDKKSFLNKILSLMGMERRKLPRAG